MARLEVIAKTHRSTPSAELQSFPEDTIMAKSKKAAQKAEPAEDTQKLYARAYAARLAKEGAHA